MASFPARYLHSAVEHNEKQDLLVFGGLDEFSQPSNELFHVDANKLKWWRHPVAARQPSARYAHTAVIGNQDGRHKVSLSRALALHCDFVDVMG